MTGAPGDVSKQRALFQTRLVETYPGATFDGTIGTVPFQNNFVATYTATTAIIDQTTPSRSTFINLSKGELMEGLEKLRFAITTADRDEAPPSGELT